MASISTDHPYTVKGPLALGTFTLNYCFKCLMMMCKWILHMLCFMLPICVCLLLKMETTKPCRRIKILLLKYFEGCRMLEELNLNIFGDSKCPYQYRV